MPQLMLKLTHSSTRKLSIAAFFTIVLSILLSNVAWAEGSAVFASVTNTDQEFELKAQIGVDFGVDVRATSVWVNQVKYIRLQSSGNKWADTRENSGGGPARRATYRVGSGTQNSAPGVAPLNVAPLETTRVDTAPVESSSEDWGVIQPATGDVSHLPLAETFPIE